MDLAMKKAKSSGVGWVSAKRSNHFGIAGHYSEMAARNGLIGELFEITRFLSISLSYFDSLSLSFSLFLYSIRKFGK